ncbi:hypothetical protein N7539_003673 [Penicillium diatomitis]|uniref:Uncharacterized protein n=1 Tax=Penicillium diatomitis TaxID=2819901 RepID=A0A9W9XDC5_9EURO|nr:uncharacterized protein N7539_003673 [Penicillium diatomitis]KAJ5488783.1 hypothetical protein N7539_003673 [Penicillium diatomitis]
MISKIVSKLRKNNSVKEPREFAGPNLVDRLQKANADLAMQLDQANQEIQTLRTRLADLGCLLTHAEVQRAHVSELNSISWRKAHLRVAGNAGPLSKSDTAKQHLTWIDNIWICTDLHYLQQAEQSWKDGDVDAALGHLQTSIARNPFLSVAESNHSRVIIAALLYAKGEYERSLGQLSDVLKLALSCEQQQESVSTEITSLAHFVEGMNLVELGSNEQAYWSYSQSLQLPGYSDQARKCQIRLVEEFTRQQTEDDSTLDNLSLRPVISSDQMRPVAMIVHERAA